MLSCNVHEQQLVIPGPVGGSHNRLHASHSSPSLPSRYASAAPPWQGRSRSAPVPATSPPLAHSSISQRQLQVQRLACLLDAPALPPQGSSPPQSQNTIRLAPARLSCALAVTKPPSQVGPRICTAPASQHRSTASALPQRRTASAHSHRTIADVTCRPLAASGHNPDCSDCARQAQASNPPTRCSCRSAAA